MDRRSFIKNAGLGGTAAVAASTLAAPAIAQGKKKLTMVTTWPRGAAGVWDSVMRVVDSVNAMTDGTLEIEPKAGGELVGAFEVFDAVSSGQADMYHGADYYFINQHPALAFFTAVPFGFTAQEINGWLHYGGGLELWRELYEPFDLVPFLCGNTGVQMGGWFNKQINSVDDLKGLKMRIPGLGGEVLRRAGGTPITLPGAEIFTSLQTGAIDATEWVGPYNDVSFGLHKAARYYYYPGWQEPGPGLECIINKDAWNSLPPDLQALVEITCQSITVDMAAEYTNGNANSLQQLLADPNIEIRSFPDEVLQHLKSITSDIVAELMATDPAAEKIGKAFYEYLEKVEANSNISERAYLNSRQG